MKITALALLQHWFEAEPTEVCNAPQHNESEIKGHQEIHSAGSERRDQIRPGGHSSGRASEEKNRSYRLFSRRADRQAKKRSPRHLIFSCFNNLLLRTSLYLSIHFIKTHNKWATLNNTSCLSSSNFNNTTLFQGQHKHLNHHDISIMYFSYCWNSGSIIKFSIFSF